MAKVSRVGVGSPIRLEDRLVLLGWLHSQLGYKSTAELLRDVKEAEEGFAPDGRSYVYSRLFSRVPPDMRAKLAEYDANIWGHLQSINAGRAEPIILKYFQYLAALYTEIFLDHYFNYRHTIQTSLNEWIAQYNKKIPSQRPRYVYLKVADLKKLAFWMATGSGKTHVMHINYLQFRHYNSEPLDNILLVTPNEGLSRQHLTELKSANISAEIFDIHGARPGTSVDTILVIEITKFKSEKHGEGASVPVSAFEGNNLVFVDEGHKGSGGQKWREMRDALGKTGFTFEYSATFGQSLAAARDDKLVIEYGNAIAFDYHYRHFYDDGYGKDFRLINLRQETTEEQIDMLLLANLISFYEQHLIFAEHGEEIRPYNIEKPLWVFVGSSVQSNSRMRSDILAVVRFLHRLLANRKWAVGAIDRLLDGRSGLKDDNKKDIFRDRFCYLRDRQSDAESVYVDILKRVLHTDHAGGLHIYNIEGSKGELGLKAAGSQHYFGLINIGDDNSFRKLVESDDTGIIIESDSYAASLFNGINKPNTVEILIGAKKFIEGWSSWRVSAMGLLNIGRSEGSQIIQLFGRGVRLCGLNVSLKRSSALTGIDHPKYIRHLETLNIFALRANYMKQFQDDLENEGAPVHGMVDIRLPISVKRDILGCGLVIPRLCEGDSFSDAAMMLEADPAVKVVVDLSPKIELIASGTDKMEVTSAAPPAGRRIPNDSLGLVDMSDIYVNLLERKEASGWHNMAVRPDVPEAILKGAQYTIMADDSVLHPKSFTDVLHLQEAASAAVIKYAERFYHMRQERWASNRMSYQALGEGDSNFQNYLVSIPADQEDLVSDIRQRIKEGDSIYREEATSLPNIHFDRHLYLPLLLARENSIKIYPPGLNEGEAKFVYNLREYYEAEKDVSLVDREIFLLRNLSRGRGVGFFQTYGFYPDFILWVRSGNAQKIVFVEPHGMLQEDAPDKSERVQLHRRVRDLTTKLAWKSGMGGVILDSYIVSETVFEDLVKKCSGEWNRRRFAKEHILFPERGTEYDYIAEIVLGDGAQQS